jgi:hypothetical protein
VAALAGALPDRGVDLPGREPLGDYAAGELGAGGGLGREVAFVGDGDDLLAEPEGEQHLGGRRD